MEMTNQVPALARIIAGTLPHSGGRQNCVMLYNDDNWTHIAHDMSQDFRCATSGAMHGAGWAPT